VLIFWQKIIAVYIFNSDFSRLETFGVIPFISFVFAYLVSMPLALASGVLKYYPYIFTFSALLLYCYGKNLIANKALRQKSQDLVIILLGFLSCGFLFLFSGRYALIEGYENRGITSSWILFSIILVRVLSYQKKWLIFLIVIIIASNYVLFLGKIEDSIRASDARRTVIAEVASQKELIGFRTPTLILDVPCLLPGARSRTEVFCTAWDVRGALAYEGIKVENVFVTENALPSYLDSLNSDAPIQVLFFNRNFKFRQVATLTPELKRKLIQQSERNASDARATNEVCRLKITQLFKLRKSGSIDEYLECARHPIS
jgi:hypothetical protein